jgi:hypothetical protein
MDDLYVRQQVLADRNPGNIQSLGYTHNVQGHGTVVANLPQQRKKQASLASARVTRAFFGSDASSTYHLSPVQICIEHITFSNNLLK